MKLGAKIAGPFGTGAKVAFWNLAATLFVGVVFATAINFSNSAFGVIFTGLFVVLTFPANQISYLGGSGVNFIFLTFLLNPLIWGFFAFVFHWAKNLEGTASSAPATPEKFNGPACVSCGVPTNPDSEFCPKCGWMQPR
jgi:hypothetical protein